MGGCGIQAGVERRVGFLWLDVEAEALLTEEHTAEWRWGCGQGQAWHAAATVAGAGGGSRWWCGTQQCGGGQ